MKVLQRPPWYFWSSYRILYVKSLKLGVYVPALREPETACPTHDRYLEAGVVSLSSDRRQDSQKMVFASKVGCVTRSLIYKKPYKELQGGDE